jgi:2-oxoglutarate ferredoxin oxidoreductase subunit delta
MASSGTKEARNATAPEVSGAEAQKKPNPRAGKFRIDVYDAWCKQCGLCTEFCPKKVLSMNPLESPKAIDPDKCIGCLLCVMHCPDFAISVTRKEDAGEEEG